MESGSGFKLPGFKVEEHAVVAPLYLDLDLPDDREDDLEIKKPRTPVES